MTSEEARFRAFPQHGFALLHYEAGTGASPGSTRRAPYATVAERIATAGQKEASDSQSRDGSSMRARKKPPVQQALSQTVIEDRALRYLDRFDASAARLRRVLKDFIRRRAVEQGEDPGVYLGLVDDVLAKYQANGIIDDQRFASNLVASLHTRGASQRAIRARLCARGITSEIADGALTQLSAQSGGDTELSAAQALVRKRKLGHYRPAGERQANFRKDLGVLARAGFDFDTAKRALALEGATDEDPF